MAENKDEAEQPKLVPIDYSRYRKADLQQMCRDRKPPLPVGGSTTELIDRLGRDDQRRGETPMVPAPPEGKPEMADVQATPDLAFLVEPDGPDETPPVAMTTTPAVVPPQPPQTTGPGRGVSALAGRGELARPGAYVAYYPCPTELSTEAHNRFLQRIAAEAVAAGRVVRGGAHRSGWIGEGDNRQAVYEISVRKEV